MNDQIPLKFKFEQDRVDEKVSEEYEVWVVQDQVVFILLLFTIFESIMPRVLSCKHVFKVRDKIHHYFNAHMKARVR